MIFRDARKEDSKRIAELDNRGVPRVRLKT